MENFSLLSVSRPRISSSALSAFPDIMSSLATSLPGKERSRNGCLGLFFPSPHQPWPLSHRQDLGNAQNGEQLRRNCTIYRPWFSPYSYFVCTDKESHLEAYGFPEVDREEGRGDNCLIEDVAESVCSSSSSQENTYPREANKKSKHGLESITSQDILMASKWHPAQQNGYKCAACCRMYPTLHSLKSHIKGGFKEGFSCKVYYRKLKTLWGKEQKARPGERLSLVSCQAFK
nr:spermatogenesis-associated protein 46 isoform X1 [Peromyscus maniculatus bairdii]